MDVVAWLRRFILADHEREHEAVDRELGGIRRELDSLEREARLRRLDEAEALRARRAGGGS